MRTGSPASCPLQQCKGCSATAWRWLAGHNRLRTEVGQQPFSNPEIYLGGGCPRRPLALDDGRRAGDPRTELELLAVCLPLPLECRHWHGALWGIRGSWRKGVASPCQIQRVVLEGSDPVTRLDGVSLIRAPAHRDVAITEQLDLQAGVPVSVASVERVALEVGVCGAPIEESVLLVIGSKN